MQRASPYPPTQPPGRYGFAAAVLDFVLPPRCPTCGARVDGHGEVCGDCWRALRFISEPLCRACGSPAPAAPSASPLCDGCAATPPLIARTRSALVYDGVSRTMILGFKHSGKLEAVASFAIWMRYAGRALLDDADLILPVPLHRRRLFERGFNQCAVLAKELTRLTGRRWRGDLLLKPNATASQQALGEKERRRNVTAATFQLSAEGGSNIADRRIVLIDDVLTTGSTLNACAAVLLQGGARTVDALTLARVVRSPLDPI